MKRKTSRDALRASQCRVSLRPCVFTALETHAVRLYGRVSLLPWRRTQCVSTAVRLYGPGDARSASLQVPIDKTEQLQ